MKRGAFLIIAGAVMSIAFGCTTNKSSTAATGGFVVLQGEMDGHPLFATIDMSLKGYKEKPTVPWFLSISTPLMNPTSDGLTTTNEASDLNGWEDAIEAIVKGAGRFVYVGRATWNGHREILYYIDGQEIVTKKLNGVIATHSMRPFAFRWERDDKWENVSIYFRQQ